MKLASLKSQNNLDGELAVVSRDLKSFVRAGSVVPSLREAIEKWSQVEPQLQKIYSDLNSGKAAGTEAVKDETIFHAALPRTWLFADGSAFIHHIKLVRQARKAPLPETLLTVPLMYQGESGRFMAPFDDIPQVDPAHGTDFEAEVGVVTDHVPMGTSADECLKHIKLVLLINDVSLRGLIPEELAQGFGFFQSKPNSALSPVAVTPDELGGDWKNGRLCLPLSVKLNGQFFGQANGSEMHFHFGQLIAHAAKTRDLPAGTIIGSGTVANENPQAGSSCLAEKRTLEQINNGEIKTPFMKDGDTVEIQMLDQKGQSIFGRILQKVKKVN
ncbi:MAG: fumarylacetoacetate hydrolase family protein [Pseudobdellovibrio sp.]|jgi:fumarylacetoacetate (FAA) hydrolase|nr:fumarylacetoacetate hydrolase family protein [Pseudobdellovibrio sp.]